MFLILVSVLIVIALIIVVVPLLRVEEVIEVSREQQNINIAKDKLSDLKQQLENSDISEEQFNITKAELENSLALDLENQKISEHHQGGRWLIALLIVAIPLASAGLYRELGNPDLLDPEQKLADLKLQNENRSNMSMGDVVALVKKRLKDNPEDGEGWYILGRTFMNIQKYPEAVTAYRRAYKLVGEEANILLALADAIAMTNEGSMIGEPTVLVEKAIALDPVNEIGLWLGGLAAEQRNDIPAAYKLWSQLLPLLRDEPTSYNEINVMLSELRDTFPELVGSLAVNSVTPEKKIVSNDKIDSGTIVNLSISIDASIRQQLTGNESVFIYAKAVSGPPMPLAAKKLKVSDLPAQVTLSDADAMMPQLTLSTVKAFTVGARVSMSGNPIPQKGDFFMEVSPLDKTSVDKVVELSIHQIVD